MHAWKPERFGFKGLVQASRGVYRVPSGLVLLSPNPGEWSQPYQDPLTQIVQIENLLRFMPFFLFF